MKNMELTHKFSKQKRISQLSSELNELYNEEEREINERYKPIFEKEYTNTFWKGRNTYGHDCKGWNTYTMITGVNKVYKSGDNVLARLTGVTFQITTDDKVILEKQEIVYARSSTLKTKITEKQFYTAYNAMLNKMRQLID